MIRGARAAKGAPSWQDLRAVYPRTPVCRAFRMHGAHILPKPAHFGCVAAICCHELALFPSEAPSGTHEAKKLPRIAARKRIAARSCHCRTPGSTFLSLVSARGCTMAKYCHGRQPENTPQRYLATVGRRGNAFRGHFVIGKRPWGASRHNLATTGRPPNVPRPTAPAGLIAKHHAMHRTRRFCRH